MNLSRLWNIYILALFAWGTFYALRGDWSLFRGMAIGAVSTLPIVVVVLPLAIKRLLIAIYSSYSYRPTRPDEFPRLDKAELERLTHEWEALGFVQCGDVAGGEATPKLGISFSRLMEHRDEGVIVDIRQHFAPSKTFRFSTLASYWGEDEREVIHQAARKLQNSVVSASPLASPDAPAPQQQKPRVDDLEIWMLVTHNRVPERLFVLLRHPRILGARLKVNAPPAQLWQVHQERVALVNARLGTTPLHSDLSTLFQDHALVLTALQSRRTRALPLWKTALAQFSPKAPAPIFDGELAPLSR